MINMTKILYSNVKCCVTIFLKMPMSELFNVTALALKQGGMIEENEAFVIRKKILFKLQLFLEKLYLSCFLLFLLFVFSILHVYVM